MHIRVYSKREEQLVEEVVETCMAIHRSGFAGDIHVSPMRLDIRKNLLGMWIPLNLVAKPFRLLRWFAALLGTSNWIYKNLDAIVGWLSTVLRFLQLSAGDGREDATLGQMTRHEMYLTHRVRRTQEDLNSLLDDMDAAIRQRRSRHQADLEIPSE